MNNGCGKIKEYNYLDELIFEGEYLNNLRHGNGKEYENGQLSFEGEYSDGERNGFGKKYNSNGQLIYEGGYLEYYRIGKGKEYDSNGSKLIYEGYYVDDKKLIKEINLSKINWN